MWGTPVIRRFFFCRWAGTCFAGAVGKEMEKILEDYLKTAVLGQVCAERDGWEGVCERVVKVTKRICKTLG